MITFLIKNFILFFKKIECSSMLSKTKSQRGYSSLSGYNILLNCYFERSTVYDLKGGIIFSENTNINLTITSCIFFKCSSYDHGGAIYIQTNLNSSLNLHKICASNCYTTAPTSFHTYGAVGQFININFNSYSLINISFFSCIKCSPQSIANIATDRSCYFQSGLLSQLNTNYSLNVCQFAPGSGYSISKDLYIQYNTIFNNSCYGNVCLYFSNCVGLLENSNFIKNNSPGPLFSVYHFQDNCQISIKNSMFFNNTNILFSNHPGNVLIILSSYIVHSDTINYPNTQNFINIYTNTFNLYHLSTLICGGNSFIPTLPQCIPFKSCRVIESYRISLFAFKFFLLSF